MEKKYNIGYVNGVFDLFHVGHLRLLKKSKDMCNYLIVGVLTDELVKHFKNHFPCIPYEQRCEIIEGLKYVDKVVKVDFNNIDKIEAWKLYHYDCLFSGDDYVNNPVWIEDKKKLNKLNSDIYFFNYTNEVSSTKIREKMKESDKRL